MERRLIQPTTKSSLSPAQRRLVELLQLHSFCRIERLQVRGGEPLFTSSLRVVKKLRMGGDNSPRPESPLQDFLLKDQVIEMLQAIARIGDGEVLAIEVKHGLPYAMEIEFKAAGAENNA